MTATAPLRVTKVSFFDIEETVKKLNRRARKLQLPEIVLTSTHAAPLMVFRHVADEGTRLAMEIDDERVERLQANNRWIMHVIETVSITLVGHGPKFDGWRLVATLEPTEDGVGGFVNVVKAVIGETVQNSYRHDIGRCDHCGTSRRRKETFVVSHDDGRQQVVGRNCIADFLGHKDVNALANYAAQLALLGHSLFSFHALDVVEQDESYSSGPREEAFPLANFIDMSVRACRVFGWVAASKASHAEQATKSVVLDHLSPPPPSRDSSHWEDAHTRLMAAEVGTDAENVIEWAKLIDGEIDSDYLFNLRTIAHVGYVTLKTAGYAASMYSAYARAQEQALESQRAAARPTSSHVGAIGERLEMTVTVDRIHEIEGNYGCTGIHKLTDSQGNDLVWFASEGTNWLDVGVTYAVKATVKGHNSYRDRDQTTINRVKVIS